MSDYEWRGFGIAPEVGEEQTPAQEFTDVQEMLAHNWKHFSEYRRKQLIERLVFFSAIHEIQEL